MTCVVSDCAIIEKGIYNAPPNTISGHVELGRLVEICQVEDPLIIQSYAFECSLATPGFLVKYSGRLR
jgi:hypothetical protein